MDGGESRIEMLIDRRADDQYEEFALGQQLGRVTRFQCFPVEHMPEHFRGAFFGKRHFATANLGDRLDLDVVNDCTKAAIGKGNGQRQTHVPAPITATSREND